jgi:glycosyltransferase involved in cell wall biosynthesis
VLAVAGLSTYPENINHKDNERIVFLGELDYMSLLSLYKRSSTFIHLAYLDHCPNVVVDAQAAGCKIICSNSGGTHEIVSNGIMINEETWNFEPIKLYQPPYMRWNETEIKKEQTGKEKPSIVKCSKKYLKIMKDLL